MAPEGQMLVFAVSFINKDFGHIDPFESNWRCNKVPMLFATGYYGLWLGELKINPQF